MEVDEADDKVQLTTFKAGLKSREFMMSPAKNPPTTMAKMLLKAQKYMNDEEALAAIRDKRSQQTRERRRTIVEDKKGSVQIAEPATGVNGETKKLLKRQNSLL